MQRPGLLNRFIKCFAQTMKMESVARSADTRSHRFVVIAERVRIRAGPSSMPSALTLQRTIFIGSNRMS